MDLRDQLDDSLEDLSDGLDVLKILEKAFEKTMRAHVVVPERASAMEDNSAFSPSTTSGEGDPATNGNMGRGASGEMSVPGVAEMSRSSGNERSAEAHTVQGSTVSASLSDTQARSIDPDSVRSNTQSHDSTFGVDVQSASLNPAIVSSSPSTSTSSFNSSVSDASEAATARTPIPLMEGSSTALLAVLEHTPLPSSPASPPLSLAHSRPRSPSPFSASEDIGNFLPRAPVLRTGKGRGTGMVLLNPQARRLLERGTPAYPVPPVVTNRGREAERNADRQNAEAKEEDGVKEETQVGGAVLRIAHLGDCMAMLVRGEEIVWRTDEMWWNVSVILL